MLGLLVAFFSIESFHLKSYKEKYGPSKNDVQKYVGGKCVTRTKLQIRPREFLFLFLSFGL